MKRGLFVAPLVWLGALAGCSVPREAEFSDVARTIEERTGHRIFWNQGGSADAAVRARVDEMLRGPLSAGQAVQIALLDNRGIQATYEDLKLAQADVVQAGLLKNPVFTASVRFPTSGSSRAPAYDLGVEQDFLDLLLIPARKRVARAMFDAAKLRVGGEVLALAHDTRVAYVSLQAAQQVSALRKTIVEAAEASVELSRRQHEAGNISDLDRSVEEASYRQLELEVMRGEGEVLAARERLTRLMGLFGAQASFTIKKELAELPPDEPPLEHLETLAVERRLDLDAARKDLAAVAEALAMAKNFRFLGGASVGAQVEHDAEGRTNVGPAASLEVPIFDQKQATIAKVVAQYRKAELRVGELAVEARSEVRETRGRLLLARAIVERYRAHLIPLRERIVALAQSHHDAMLLGIYQLLQLKQAEATVYREYIEAVRDYWIARADLERAVGGALPSVDAPPKEKTTP